MAKLKLVYIICSGAAIAAGFGLYYLYDKYVRYTFSYRVTEYIDEIEPIIHKIINNDTTNSGNILAKRLQIKMPIELLCLVIITTNEITEELYEEEFPGENELRINALRKVSESTEQNNGHLSFDYTGRVLEMIKRKEDCMNRSFDCLNKLLAKRKLDLNFKMNTTYSQLEQLDVNLFKSTLSAYQKHFEPEEGSKQYDYYRRLKLKLRDENTVKQLFEFLYELQKDQRDKIVKAKQEDRRPGILTRAKINFSESNRRSIQLNEIVMRDQVELQFGIKYNDFIYLMETNEHFLGDASMRLKIDKLDEEDRIIM